LHIVGFSFSMNYDTRNHELKKTNQLILVIENEYVLCEEGKNRRIICYFLSKSCFLWGEIDCPSLSESYTSTPTHAFIVFCLIIQRSHFTNRLRL